MNLWNDPVGVIAQFIGAWLTGLGAPSWLASLVLQLVGVVVLVSMMMIIDIGLVWVERKVVARFQSRLGPNRVGPFGIIQPLADIIKLLIKEDITPDGADRVIYNLAPILSLMAVLLLWAIIPLAPVILGVDLNVGALYIVAAGAIGTLAIIMAGWASNNKYALIGAFRQVAVLVSFEVPMIATLLIPTILAGSMGMNAIIQAQNVWYIFLAPLAAIIFMVAAIAELGRAPFDMNEAESEIVAGFHIEYTGMKFGLFYAGELLHAFTFGGFWAILFFGGYRLFGLERLGPIVAAAILMGKALFGYWVIMWVRYTVMRIRIDHMLAFNWKFLTPLAFGLLMLTALVHAALRGASPVVSTAGLLLSNFVVGFIVFLIARGFSKRQRARLEGPARPVPAGESESCMDLSQIIFGVLALVILGSAFAVVITRNMVHAALWLIVTLFGVAAAYAYLNAGFLAVVQVVIYIGAIAILFIFAVMLTRKEIRDQGPQSRTTWWLSAIVTLLVFGGLVLLVQSWGGFTKPAADIPAGFDAVGQLGNALVSPTAFVLPFEVASVLLLAALVGAVYIAFARK